MVVVFLSFGVIALPQLGVTSLSDFWTVANERIWTGGEPLPGRVKFTFWHVLFFAWFCNMAMHIGMSDLTIFRYAKKSWYSVATAAGMYLGHFMAWISASLLYALQLHRDPTMTDVLPGPMAFGAAGLVGVICVVIAGWTTANPTIYRAGLAFQAIAPSTSRVKVTLFAGGLATLAGMFPAIAMQLLDFVALYGLVLMPMGAVIFIDFWLMRRLGLRDNYAEWKRISFNWAAGLAWILTLLICLGLVAFGGLQIFFASLPGWFIAAALYIVLSKWYQRNDFETASQEATP